MLETLVAFGRVFEIILGVGLLIFVHEFGHFLMAKRHGVRVEVFSLGFGPALWKSKKGETEYRLCLIPLGGFVKMAGETHLEETTGSPDEFVSKPAWQRFQIFVAGALMNLLIAFPICVVAFLVGRTVPAPVLGHLSPASKSAGLLPGDRVLKVGETEIQDLVQYHMAILQYPQGSNIPVTIERNGQRLDKTVVQQGSRQNQNTPPFNVIEHVNTGSPAALAGLKPRDRIVKIGKTEFYGIGPSRGDLSELLRNTEAPEKKAIDITIARFVGEENPVEEQRVVQIEPTWQDYYELPTIDTCEVANVLPDKPADGKLLPGDQILKVDGEVVHGIFDFQERVQKYDKEITITLLRSGEEQTVKITPENKLIGIVLGESTLDVLPALDENSFYYKAGLRAGDKLISIDDKKGNISIQDLYYADKKQKKRMAFKQEKKIEVKVSRNGEPVSVILTPDKKNTGLIGIETVEEGPYFSVGYDLMQQTTFRQYGLGDSLRYGLDEPIVLVKLTFLTLYKLFAREESPKDLAGPVGIFHFTYKSAEQGTGNFLWLLGLLAVNLGVFNLLPVPVLDGGHVLLLVIEKIKGKPLSEKFIATFQYAGLILLLSLVVYVTYADITRLMS